MFLRQSHNSHTRRLPGSAAERGRGQPGHLIGLLGCAATLRSAGGHQPVERVAGRLRGRPAPAGEMPVLLSARPQACTAGLRTAGGAATGTVAERLVRHCGARPCRRSARTSCGPAVYSQAAAAWPGVRSSASKAARTASTHRVARPPRLRRAHRAHSRCPLRAPRPPLVADTETALPPHPDAPCLGGHQPQPLGLLCRMQSLGGGLRRCGGFVRS